MRSGDEVMPAVLGIAAGQHGVVLTRQMTGAGISPRVAGRLARQTILVPVRRGAWVVGRPPTDWQQAVAAGLLAGPGSALSHTTAARFHRLPVAVPAARRPELSVVYPRSLDMEGVTVHRVRSLDGPDVRCPHGLRVTSPARTLVDLAAVLPEPAAARLVDEALISRIVTPAELDDAAGRIGARRGMQTVRALIAQRIDSPTADSQLEIRVIQVLGPLAPFEVHYQLLLDGTLLILDMAWPEHRVAIECDGWAVHGRSRTKFDRDRRRENLLVSHGWVVAHITSAMSDDEIFRTALNLLLGRPIPPGGRQRSLRDPLRS